MSNKAHLHPHPKKRQASRATGLLLVILFIALVALATAMVASGHAMPAGRIIPLREAVVLGLHGADGPRRLRSRLSEEASLNAPLDGATLTRSLDTVRGAAGSRGSNFAQALTLEDERNTVVGCPAVSQLTGSDQPLEHRPPLFLPVVVRAATPGQESQPVTKRRQLRDPERVGHGLVEPAVHSRAQPAQDDALLPGAAENAVKPMGTPNREQVGRITAAYVDHILHEDERFQVTDAAFEQLKVGRAGSQVSRTPGRTSRRIHQNRRWRWARSTRADATSAPA